MENQKIKPNNIKFNSSHRALLPNNFNLKKFVNNNSNSLISIERGFITNNQLSASLLTLKKLLKHQGKIDYNVFPNIPVSKRPLELTLGRGKAAYSYWVTIVKPGTLIFKVTGDNLLINKKALIKASRKFNFLTKVV